MTPITNKRHVAKEQKKKKKKEEGRYVYMERIMM